MCLGIGIAVGKCLAQGFRQDDTLCSQGVLLCLCRRSVRIHKGILGHIKGGAVHIRLGEEKHLVVGGDPVLRIIVIDIETGLYLRLRRRGAQRGVHGQPLAVEIIVYRTGRPNGVVCTGCIIFIGSWEEPLALLLAHSSILTDEIHFLGFGVFGKQQRLVVLHLEDVPFHAVDEYRIIGIGAQGRHALDFRGTDIG